MAKRTLVACGSLYNALRLFFVFLGEIWAKTCSEIVFSQQHLSVSECTHIYKCACDIATAWVGWNGGKAGGLLYKTVFVSMYMVTRKHTLFSPPTHTQTPRTLNLTERNTWHYPRIHPYRSTHLWHRNCLIWLLILASSSFKNVKFYKLIFCTPLHRLVDFTARRWCFKLRIVADHVIMTPATWMPRQQVRSLVISGSISYWGHYAELWSLAAF